MPRLFLHVGLAKTGTTFLQTILAENRPALREAGFIYPFVRREGMFHAAVEVREDHERWGLQADDVRGTWASVLAKARAFDGTAVVSHELLAGATPDQVRRAGRELDGFDLDIVLTARDPARQVPAHWQEAVKNGETVSFAQLSTEVLGQPGAPDTRFWREQDLLAVAERWAALVAPERVHVVVCPPTGAQPLELWRLFAGVLGIPEEIAGGAADREANASLGAPEVHLLRRLNRVLEGRLDRRSRALVVKRLFAQRLLSGLDSPRALAPESLGPALEALADGWITGLAERGFRVHGDPEDLRPTRFGEVEPDRLRRRTTPATVEAMAALLVEVAALRGEAGQDPGGPTGAASTAGLRSLAASVERRARGRLGR